MIPRNRHQPYHLNEINIDNTEIKTTSLNATLGSARK